MSDEECSLEKVVEWTKQFFVDKANGEAISIKDTVTVHESGSDIRFFHSKTIPDI